MQNCIFSGHCMESRCDKSCPILVQTSYLLERNNISLNSNVFKTDPSQVNTILRVLDNTKGKFGVIIDNNDTAAKAELVTYCAICQNWKGSQLHCVVYHLKFSQYVEEIQKSWSSRNGESENLEYIKIWTKTCKVLIISGIDFVNFKNFQCQTLLELLQQRNSNPDNTTIIVSPPLSALVGDGAFFGRLQDMMRKAVI